MTNEPLPPELAELETRLARRTTSAGPALRKRVLDAVAGELAGRTQRGDASGKHLRPPDSRGMGVSPMLSVLRQIFVAREHPRVPDVRARASVLAHATQSEDTPVHIRPALTPWSFFAAAAAILIVALNISGMVAGMTDYIDGHARGPQQTLALARSIRQAVPDLSPAQAQSMAVTLSSGQHLLALPVLHGSSPTNRTIIQEP